MGMTAGHYADRLMRCVQNVQATGPHKNPLTLDTALSLTVDRLRVMHAQGGEVHLIGNGGTAAIMAHVHNDLIKACAMRARIYQDAPLLTAIANDQHYADTCAMPLGVLLRPVDVVIAASSSGMSANILAAVRVAQTKAAVVITLSGFTPENRLRQCGDVNFYVPATEYGLVELSHATLLHYLTDAMAHAG